MSKPALLNQRQHSAMSGDAVGGHDRWKGASGMQGAEARDAARTSPSTLDSCPPNRDYMAQNVRSADTETLGSPPKRRRVVELEWSGHQGAGSSESIREQQQVI